jgi:hypothetical protein
LDVDSEQAVAVSQPPRADEIAGAEQLGAGVVGERELTHDDALKHEQAEVGAAPRRRPRHLAGTEAEAVRSDE